MASELIGTIHQYINRCKDTIVEWCKDAAKTVCLPLTGGNVTGTINTTKLTVNTESSIDNGTLILKKQGDNSSDIILRLAETVQPRTNNVPSDQKWAGIYARSVSGYDVGKFFTRVSPDKTTESVVCVHSYDNSSHYHLSINYSPTEGVYTQAPTPSSATDNSTKIATTAWVNNFLSSVSSESVKWQKTEVTASAATSTKPQGMVNQTCVRLREGLQICFGIVANAKPNYLVTFAKPFINAEYAVTATLHYGGSESGTGLIGSRAHEDSSVHVYQTNATSFRLGRDMFYADYNSWINQGVDIGLGWVEWIAIGWWKR